MGRDRNRHRISAKRTLARRKRRPRNVYLGICYVPSTSQTSQSDVFGTSLERQCAIWDIMAETLIQLSQNSQGSLKTENKTKRSKRATHHKLTTIKHYVRLGSHHGVHEAANAYAKRKKIPLGIIKTHSKICHKSL
jgi:hypothetical protein